MNTERGSLVGAVIVGFIAAVICAVIWGAISIATGYQIGWIAIGVGFVVGVAVNVVGKGQTPSYGVIGGGLSLLALILGNVICVAGVLANLSGEGDMPEKISVVSAVFRLLLNPGVTLELMKLTFSPMDILFYGLALYMGFKCSYSDPNKAEA